MSLFATPYVSTTATKTAAYSVGITDDLVPFTITGAVNATLPLTSTAGYGGQQLSNRTGGQGVVYIQNNAASNNNVTITATSGDALFGTITVLPGQIIKCVSNGSGIWYCGDALGAGAGSLVRYQQTCLFSAFTDGGGAAGTLALGTSVPAGAVYARTLFSTLTGFTGNTSATATLGDGTDVDRYNTGTPDFFTTAAAGVDAGVPSGTLFHSAAKTPTLTVTANSDWGLVVAGSVLVSMFWYTPF